jgi:protein SCO1/2
MPLIALIAPLLLLVGCSPETVAKAPPLEGAPIGGPFTLTNQNGNPMSDTAFAGRYRIMYFGYSYCPDVCPTDLAKIGQALRLVDEKDPLLGAKVVPIFVTVDPERDTPKVIKEFVANFHPRMIGLTGSVADIKKTADEFRIYFAKLPPATPGGGYLVDHTRVAYLLGPKGEPIAPLTADMTPDMIRETIVQWVK